MYNFVQHGTVCELLGVSYICAIPDLNEQISDQEKGRKDVQMLKLHKVKLEQEHKVLYLI
jgi:hypothetical protein